MDACVRINVYAYACVFAHVHVLHNECMCAMERKCVHASEWCVC